MSTVKKLLLSTNIDPYKSAGGDVGVLIPLIPNNAGVVKSYSITAANLWKLGNVVYDSAHKDFSYAASYGSNIHSLTDWLDSVNEKYIKQFEWNFTVNPSGYAGFYFGAASGSSASTTGLNFDFYASVAGDVDFTAKDAALVSHTVTKAVVPGWQAFSIPWIGAVGTGFSQTTFAHPADSFNVDPASTMTVGMIRIDTVRYDDIQTMAAAGNIAVWS